MDDITWLEKGLDAFKNNGYQQYLLDDQVRTILDDYFRHKPFSQNQYFTCDDHINRTSAGYLEIDTIYSDPTRYDENFEVGHVIAQILPDELITINFLSSFILLVST
jgi:hypothetical protein